MTVCSVDPRIVRYLQRIIGCDPHEQLHAVFADEHSRYVGDVRVAQGEKQSVGCSLSTLFDHARHLRADRFLLAHNHPSGDLTPSDQDRQATHRIAIDAAAHGLHLIDHLVVTRWGGFSLRFETML